MRLAKGPQRSDAGEVGTRSPLVSSRALYHWATVLPVCVWWGVGDPLTVFWQNSLHAG